MSRGAKVFYATVPLDYTSQVTVNSSISAYVTANYAADTVQYGDVMVDTTGSAVQTTDTLTHGTTRDILQFDGTDWVVLSSRETSFTDQNLRANVTKIRIAHTEDMRSYLNFIQRVYAKRYGDTWFNTHDMSHAVLKWSQGTDFAKIYIANYAVDEDYLTLEVGDNIDDKVRFVNRTPSSNSLISYILDIGGNLIKGYVNAEFVHDLTVKENFFVTLASEFTGTVTMLGDHHVKGNSFAEANLTVSGDLTVIQNFLIVGNSLIQGNATVTGDLDVGGIIRPSTGTTKGIQFVQSSIKENAGQLAISSGTSLDLQSPAVLVNGEAILLSSSQGHGNGLNADRVDGYHYSDIQAGYANKSELAIDADINTTWGAGNKIAKRISVNIGGTVYFIQGAETQDAICHGQCHSNCHNNCHGWHMCYTGLDSQYRSDNKTVDIFDVKGEIYE